MQPSQCCFEWKIRDCRDQVVSTCFMDAWHIKYVNGIVRDAPDEPAFGYLKYNLNIFGPLMPHYYIEKNIEHIKT